jgi:GntR family transcriptional repressor for pyruvate dehydrogenase complex
MSVTTEAIEKIKAMIVSGEVGPGDKLPREKELAEALGLSRNSLREAVRALAALNVIEVRQGDGTYLSSLAPKVLLDVVGFGMDLVNDPTLLEIFEVRRFLETAATAAATVRIGDEELEALRACMARMDLATSTEDLVKADEEFHHIVASATGNSVLVALLDNLSSRTVRARIWRAVMEQGAVEKTKQWHHAILQGIEARDPQMARAADLLHIVEGESWLRRTLGIDGAGELSDVDLPDGREIGGQ